MNRFNKHPKREHPALRSILLPAVMFLSLLLFLGYGVSSISQTADAEQLKSTRQAIARAAAHSYAVTGAYPPTLDALVAGYGLPLERDKYIIDYRCFASNVMPEITVLPLEGAA